MLEKEMRVKGTVRFLIEIESGSVWGGDCTIAQIYKQVCDGAIDILNKGIADSKIKVVGPPVVYSVDISKE
jgi:hypothetical protein